MLFLRFVRNVKILASFSTSAVRTCSVFLLSFVAQKAKLIHYKLIENLFPAFESQVETLGNEKDTESVNNPKTNLNPLLCMAG